MSLRIPRQIDVPSPDIPTDLPSDFPSLTLFPPSSSQPPPSEPSSEPPSSADPSTISDDSTTFPPSSSAEPSESSSDPPPPSSTTRSSLTRPTPSRNNDLVTEPPISTTDASITESTTSFTTVTTSINGTLTTYTSAITALANPSTANPHNEARTALIAGLTTGLIVLLLLLLGTVFAYRRHKYRRQQEVLAVEKRKKETKNLLDAEGFDDDEESFFRPRSHGYPSPLSGGAVGRSISPSPSPIRSRASETGSIFREEVWPPPQDDLVDPIYKESSQVDLSRIVDQVMGPSMNRTGHDRRPTDSTLDSTSTIAYDRRRSSDSYAPSFNSQYGDPFQSYPPPTVHPSHNATNHLYSSPSDSFSPLTPENPGQMLSPPPAMTAVSTYPASLHRPPSPSAPLAEAYPPPPIVTSPSSLSQASFPASRSSPTSALGANWVNSQPKKSSPLARALTQDAKLWLSRTPHPPNSP